MIKRKKLGQHFLNSNKIANSIVLAANITKEDTVFELGTGLGILTPLLCEKADAVISVDADEQLIEHAKITLGRIDNLLLKSGDGFKMNDSFSIFVSNLPYSRSRDAIEWLARIPFSHGIIMVQKEFADKLLAKSSKFRRAISVIANYAFEIEVLHSVDKNNFSPPPKIDSVILKLTQKNTIKNELIQTINKIFSYRRKTVKNILKQFGVVDKYVIDKRVDDLSEDEIINLANQILEK